MKIVRIDGGLGNQMFCYAFAIALQKKSNQPVYLDSHRYAFFPNHFGYELTSLFNIQLQEATQLQLWKVTNVPYNVLMSKILNLLPRRKTEIIEDYQKYEKNLMVELKDGYYIGNWQCYKYFDDYKKDIQRAFSFKNRLDKRNAIFMSELLEQNNTVSLHIRRGDYLSDPKYCGICELDYYKQALEHARNFVKGRLHCIIFSNDINWCKQNILPLVYSDEVTFVDWNTGLDSHKDMRLMSACRVNIIANSSFSWWAAYLNKRDNHLVIAPRKWINLPINYNVPCEEWLCI